MAVETTHKFLPISPSRPKHRWKIRYGAWGVKKALVIEAAVLHHLQALNELPADIA